MNGEGKISVESGSGFETWSPEHELARIDATTARYSRGFCACQPLSFFAGLAELWLPLSQSLGIEMELLSCTIGFEAPENVTRAVSWEANEEKSYLLYSGNSPNILSQAVVPEIGDVGADVVLEYLERRLLSTLCLSWRGTGELQCVYIGEQGRDSTDDAIGYVHVRHRIANQEIGCSFGLGRELLDFLDHSVRMSIVKEKRKDSEHTVSDHIHSVSVEIAELAVPPAMLIDYIRADTIVDLETPKSRKVLLRLDGEPWAEGELSIFENSYAVRITSIEPNEKAFTEGTTRVRVEIASTELDVSGVMTHQQVGAVLLCDTPARSQASLIISGENVARAAMGTIADSFAVRVLPK